ncbi:peptidoglycan-binding protein [Phyllobacterium phragmitis]|uniref:Peptidoglycan-binding protein n=1 Tax=Phyllobacterium phragmitis TaxID=2670329 RepID=A0A2S9INP3_9HYPH|nr:N-acetylmuramidase domain-containing protein [Phyllobacterium phragmitis]PRD42144.1 peptidoglycan-binding protein [Phyllobacterium phragmitis]
MFTAEQRGVIAAAAKTLGCEPAALMAVIDVESAGEIFAVVKGHQLPVIRWEGHYFYRLVHTAKRGQAVNAGLANAKAGGVKNPKSQAARYALLDRAANLDKQAAYSSCSWGIGQVMGAHWDTLGFASVLAMVDRCKAGFAGQVDVMCRYIDKFGLADELRRHDWAGFARGYNGPAYAKYGYHTKIKTAYERYRGAASPASPASGMLRMGSHGARVRELQQLLARAGQPITVDGDFGPSTKAAVKAFQMAANIADDGVAGPQTLAALQSYRVGPDETPGAIPAQLVSEVQTATKGGGIVVMVAALQKQISDTAVSLTGIDASAAQTISGALMAGAGILGAGLAVYAIYGLVKSRRTYEGTS